MSYYPEFSELIEDHLAKRDRSLTWLSKQLGVHKNTVTRWVNHGSRPSSAEMVVRVANVLDIEKKALLVAAGYGYVETKSKNISSEKIGGNNNYMSYYPDFSRLIEDSLAKTDRSASWLAQRLGQNPSTVGRWLNHGTRPSSTDLVVRIADILRIDAHTLLHAAGYGYITTETTPAIEFVPVLSEDFQPNTNELVKNETQNTFICNVMARGDICINIELSNHEHLHQYDTLINNVESKEGNVYITLKQTTQDQNEVDNAVDESHEPGQGVQLHLFAQSTDNRDENQYTETFVQQVETVEVSC